MTHPEIERDLQIDRICTSFEAELQADQTPRIEVYLDDITGEMRELVLRELLALELWYARERNQILAIAEYLARFPDQQQIVRDCFTEDALPPSPEPDRFQTTEDSSQAESAESLWNRSKPAAELPPKFGRYRILKRLGEGGMGSVYLAEDEALDRQIALKVPRCSEKNGSGTLSRFRREAQAAARIVHPNLCPVYDIGEIDGIFYLTMAYIEGQSLADHIMQRRPINLPNTLGVIRKTAQALAEAHDKGVIHRDLKPSNIMINSRGEPVVVDFGLARTDISDQTRLTATGAIVGTPAYASPEQIESRLDIDARTDIYSLGVILYELLTGRLPFQASSPFQLLQRILGSDPPAPSTVRASVPKELDAICLKAIAKKAEDRYPTMQAFDEALEKAESQMEQPENSRPAWFQQTVIATPSQIEEPPSKPAEPARGNSQAERSRSSAAGRLKEDRPATKLTLWVVPVAILLLIGMIVWWQNMGDNSGEGDQVAMNEIQSWPSDNTGESKSSEPVEKIKEPNNEAIEGKDPEIPLGEVPVVKPSRKPPEFRVQFPVPLGGWTKLTGRLWHAPLPEQEGLHFRILLRCVDEKEIDGRLFQVLEIEVTTVNNNHLEQASLLVDVDSYRDKGEFRVKDGWLLAPKDKVFAKFNSNPDIDALAVNYPLGELPEQRLSVQDVLALLFKADVKTTQENYRWLHDKILAERNLVDQGLNVSLPEESGTDYTLVKTNGSAEEFPVDYTLELCPDSSKVPFTWGAARINLQQLSQPIFSATLNRERGGVRKGENIAELMSYDWTLETPDPIPRNDFAYLNLPAEAGAWCRFEVNLLVPALSNNNIKLNRVEVRVLDQEIVNNIPYRWIEVESQMGESLASGRITETVKLLVNEDLYRKERKFEFLQDPLDLEHQAGARLQVGNEEPFYVRFDPYEDRMQSQHGASIPNRLPIRNVLSLMFGAEFTPHFLPFNIREHVSYALTDGLLRRHFIPKKAVHIPEQGDLSCTLVRPGRSVSIVKGNHLPPTTLGYNINIGDDPQTYPFGWVDMELNLFEEKDDRPGDRIFGGTLKLRAYGKGAKSRIKESMKYIVSSGDPGEANAFTRSKFYFETAKDYLNKGESDAAIERYKMFINRYPRTLAAYQAQKAIDDLRRNP